MAVTPNSPPKIPATIHAEEVSRPYIGMKITVACEVKGTKEHANKINKNILEKYREAVKPFKVHSGNVEKAPKTQPSAAAGEQDNTLSEENQKKLKLSQPDKTLEELVQKLPTEQNWIVTFEGDFTTVQELQTFLNGLDTLGINCTEDDKFCELVCNKEKLPNPKVTGVQPSERIVDPQSPTNTVG